MNLISASLYSSECINLFQSVSFCYGALLGTVFLVRPFSWLFKTLWYFKFQGYFMPFIHRAWLQLMSNSKPLIVSQMVLMYHHIWKFYGPTITGEWHQQALAINSSLHEYKFPNYIRMQIIRFQRDCVNHHFCNSYIVYYCLVPNFKFFLFGVILWIITSNILGLEYASFSSQTTQPGVVLIP